jgi:hypothetical protein
MTRVLIFDVTDADGRNVGGWSRPRGATPLHRRTHLEMDRCQIAHERANGRTVKLHRIHGGRHGR